MIALALIAGFGSANVVMTREEDGALLDFKPGLVRLKVCSDRIIRVTSVPGDRLPDVKSLVVERTWNPPKWYLKEDGRTATLSTSKMKVRVDLTTGKLAFYDLKGNLLLSESGPGARAFKPTMLVDEPTFAAEQRFKIQPGEAFYGLGSLQKECLNYAGRTLTLQQVNTVACNPVLVSNKGYGLIWDNASRTVVDLGDNTSVLGASALLDKERKPGGLTGEYFKGRDFEEPAGTRLDPGIDFEWTGAPPLDLPKTDYSVRWTGFVKTDKAGDYTFVTESDDGVRLWVNGRLLIDGWSTQPLTMRDGRIRLPANAVVPVKMEFYQEGGESICRLKWRPPGRNATAKWSSDFADQIDYYVLYGPEMDQIVAAYRDATGRAPLYGKWAYGLWQCKERYQTQQELLDIAEGYRSRQIPIDNIVQDWFYWDPNPWGSHLFDPKRYPDFAGAVAQLHEKYKLHLMISVWAKFAPGSDNFKEMDSKGLLLADDGQGCRYYDPFGAEGRAVYWRQMSEKLFAKGVDAWWLDATEPEMNATMFRDSKTASGYGGRYQNAFPLMTTKAVYEGQRAETDAKRVFILTRSVFAGQQRNAATTWSGDIWATWDVFRRQVAGGLNFCMAGVPYWCTDIGAFFGGDCNNPEYRELFTRWFQWGAFCPIFRVHGTGTDKELWRFGPETEAALVKVDRLRYRLLPYIYSLAWRVTSDGYTMMRGLPMDFRSDPKTAGIGDQLMFGPALMVSPVLRAKAASRSVYLPKGATWYDFWTGRRFQGGRTVTVPTPLDSFPLHVRAGSILAMGPSVQYASEKPADPIELRVYTGADGYFQIYEDENDGYGYEKGARAIIPVRWVEKKKRLYIGKRVGTFPSMQNRRRFRIVWVRPGKGTGVAPSPADATVEYDGSAVCVRRK